LLDHGISERIKILEDEARKRVRYLEDINARTKKAFDLSIKASDKVKMLEIDNSKLRKGTNESLETTARWCKSILEKTDDNSASISQLKHNIAHLTLQSEQTQKSINMLSNSLDITQSTIMSVNEKISVNKTEPKKSALSQIPLKAWITGGAVLIIVLIYLKTGHLITIKEITG